MNLFHACEKSNFIIEKYFSVFFFIPKVHSSKHLFLKILNYHHKYFLVKIIHLHNLFFLIIFKEGAIFFEKSIPENRKFGSFQKDILKICIFSIELKVTF